MTSSSMTPEEARALLEDGNVVDQTTGVRVRRVPSLTNGVPIGERPPLRAGDHATIAEELVDHELEGCLVDEEKIWRCTDGVWGEIPDREAQKVLMAYSRRPFYVGEKTKELTIDRGDVTGTMACAKDLLARPGYFDGVRAGVGFKNGFLAIVDGKATLLDPDGEHRIRAAHPFDWDRAAPRVELDAFWDTVFAEDSEEEGADKRALLQQFFGAAMFGLAPSYQKCLLFFGKAGNGKSEILKILTSVFPDPSVLASLPPHMWGEQFAVEALSGKLANLVDEVPSKDIVAGNMFKAVITGNPVAAERKYQPKFTFRPRAAHVFACNELPNTADLSEAFFDRFIVLHFRRKFRDTIFAEADIADRVIAACRAGIVAWAVEGAEQLIAQKRYTIPSTSREALEHWRKNCDNVTLFFDEDTEPVLEGGGTAAPLLYTSYVEWCESGGYKAVNRKNFVSRAETAGHDRMHNRAGDYFAVRRKLGV